MNLEALWHAETGGPVLDVGAGTGRVALDLARGGVPVVALDRAPRLLDALAHRGAGLPVETVVADARRLDLSRRFALIVMPMQTLQLLGGRRGRGAFLRRALAHLAPGGLLAAALADAADCFDEEHELPPPPTVRDVAGGRYASRLLAEDVTIRLDRVAPDTVAAEARAIGFRVEPQRCVPETERYLGSAVVMLRAR